MPFIHPDTVDKVRESALILDVVESFVTDLKKTGSNYKAKSPFTNEKTPSFVVTPSKNIFKCFSSGIGGDPIRFLMEHEKFDFHQAISWLADKYGISQKAYTPTKEEKKEIEEKEQYYKINEASNKHYNEALMNLSGDHDGFKELINHRLLSPDTILTFELGYALDSWSHLSSKLKEKALNTQACTLGLIGKNQGNHHFDKLRHRITFPIRDYNKRLVGFGAGALHYEVVDGKKHFYEYIDGKRFVNKQKEPQKVGKYINSTDSPIYNKSASLFGIHLAQDAIRKMGCAYLTEGYFDVITPYQNGLRNVVGVCGTALTKEQIKLLNRFTHRIIIMYDGDNAGRTSAISAAELLINQGLSAEIVELPEGEDPDSLFRFHDTPFEFVKNNTRHAILTKADFELTDDLNEYDREVTFKKIANLIAAIDGDSIRDTLIKGIAKAHNITAQVLRKMVADFLDIRNKNHEKDRIRKRKNEVFKLEGNPEVYPFFEEKVKDDVFKGIDINKMRFIKLLSSFGYSRYEIDQSDAKTFVRIHENLIYHVKRDEIIDHLEDFIKHEYNFEKAGFEHVDAERLLNKFYSGIRTYFSSDLFARVRNSQSIIINKDTKKETFFYFKNGYVEVDAEGWRFKEYNEMEGGIWADQVNQRDFQFSEVRGKEISPEVTGVFSDFVKKIAGEEDTKRFLSLCSHIGYLVHDFYHYKLRLVNFTDSSLNKASDGRSGKTLLTKMLGYIRNVGEINGKEFRASDKNKYADLDIYSQITVINDIITQGRDKLYFEDLFNDITEGQMVKKLYMDPFRISTKMIINSNGPLDIKGSSAADRVLEFELSQYFNTNHSPLDEYNGMYLGNDFDQKEWMLYDNFMCYCAHVFHSVGIIETEGINLGRRKLIAHVNEWVLMFLDECKNSIDKHGIPWENFVQPENWVVVQVEKPVEKSTTVEDNTEDSEVKVQMVPAKPALNTIKIDKREWYNKMIEIYGEIDAKWVTQNKFTKYLNAYAEHEYGIKNPKDYRSGGKGWFIFREDEDK